MVDGGTKKSREGEFKVLLKNVYFDCLCYPYNFSNLNGKLLKAEEFLDQAMHWGESYSLKSAKMLIRPKN